MMDLQFGGMAQARTPGLQLYANGGLVRSPLSAEIISTGYHAASRFRAALAVSSAEAIWFSTQCPILLDIQIGLDGSWVTLSHGQIDSIMLDPLAGVLQVEGRDLTAALIGARTSESFVNHTASEVVEILAARHSLTPSVTATSTEVGRYYQSEHSRNTLNQYARVTTEWDLLVFLAQQEGFDVYVDGTTLNFHSLSEAQTSSWNVSVDDCMELRLERSLTLASDIDVTVRSWNSRQQSTCVQTARTVGAGSGGTAQNYVFVRPNMTPDQAQQFAQTMLERDAFGLNRDGLPDAGGI